MKKVYQFKDPEPPTKQTKKQSASFLKEPSSAGCSYKTAPSSVTLQVEVDIFRSQVSNLEHQLSNAPKAFLFDSIEGGSTLVQHYTGLPSADVFNVLLQLCARFKFSYYCRWNVSSISQQDQLFLFTWINVLHEVLYVGLLKDKIPSVSKNRLCLPSCFSNFSNCRIILDCTEIQSEVPSNMESQSVTFSLYKQRHTFKGLI